MNAFRRRVAVLLAFAGAYWWGWRTEAGPLELAAAWGGMNLAGASGTAHALAVPAAPQAGWWLARVKLPAREARMRVNLPLGLPGPVHFHVLILPENNALTFTGSRASWPKGGMWPAGGAGVTWLPITQVTAHAGGSGMPWRLSPSLAGAAPGPGIAWGPNGDTLVWTAVQSGFGYHAALAHAPVEEFRPGSRTGWLVLTLTGLPADAKSAVLALAPYHRDDASGEDWALSYDYGSGAPAAPWHPRREGDYPNDPVALWDAFHEDAASSWLRPAFEGWMEELGAQFYSDTARYSTAWVASAMRWGSLASGGVSVTMDASWRRPGPWERSRRLVQERSVKGLTKGAARLTKGLLAPYQRAFLLPAAEQQVAPPEPAPPAAMTLNVFADPRFPGYISERMDHPFDSDKMAKWIGEVERRHAGFAVKLDRWFKHVLAWVDNIPGFGELGGSHPLTAVLFAIMETKGYALAFNPLNVMDTVGGMMTWLISDPQGVFDVLLEVTMSSSTGLYTGEYTTGTGVLPEPTTDLAVLRAPVAWAVLAPPIFGQLSVLGSMEPMTAWFSWWRSAAGGLHQAMTGFGLDPVRSPWEGWFPVGSGPADAGGWWQAFQEIPWARSVLPVAPTDWTTPSHWRYQGEPDLDFWQRLSRGDYWPPEPPATRQTSDSSGWPTIRLRTAAYVLGPIEVEVRP